MFRPGHGVLLRVGATGLIGLALVWAAGCGKAVGKVTGTVKFKDGTSAPAGTLVNFWSTDGKRVYPGMVGPDGTYMATDVPLGELKVTVTPPPEVTQPRTKSSEKALAKPPPVIPPKYKDLTNTTLKFTVQKGDNTYSIVLD
jgi:hypothetical protein